MYWNINWFNPLLKSWTHAITHFVDFSDPIYFIFMTLHQLWCYFIGAFWGKKLNLFILMYTSLHISPPPPQRSRFLSLFQCNLLWPCRQHFWATTSSSFFFESFHEWEFFTDKFISLFPFEIYRTRFSAIANWFPIIIQSLQDEKSSKT